MDLAEISKKAKERLAELTGLPASTMVGIAQEEGAWLVTLEMIEKKSIPESQDILGTYEVKVDGEGNIVNFARTKLRRRSDVREG